MDFHECPWISTDFHECPWISMKKQAPLFYPSHFSVPAPKNKHLCSTPATFRSRHPKTSTFILPRPLFGPGTQKQAPLPGEVLFRLGRGPIQRQGEVPFIGSTDFTEFQNKEEGSRGRFEEGSTGFHRISEEGSRGRFQR